MEKCYRTNFIINFATIASVLALFSLSAGHVHAKDKHVTQAKVYDSKVGHKQHERTYAKNVKDKRCNNKYWTALIRTVKYYSQAICELLIILIQRILKFIKNNFGEIGTMFKKNLDDETNLELNITIDSIEPTIIIESRGRRSEKVDEVEKVDSKQEILLYDLDVTYLVKENENTLEYLDGIGNENNVEETEENISTENHNSMNAVPECGKIGESTTLKEDEDKTKGCDEDCKADTVRIAEDIGMHSEEELLIEQTIMNLQQVEDMELLQSVILQEQNLLSLSDTICKDLLKVGIPNYVCAAISEMVMDGAEATDLKTTLRTLMEEKICTCKTLIVEQLRRQPLENCYTAIKEYLIEAGIELPVVYDILHRAYWSTSPVSHYICKMAYDEIYRLLPLAYIAIDDAFLNLEPS